MKGNGRLDEDSIRKGRRRKVRRVKEGRLDEERKEERGGKWRQELKEER